MPLQIISVLVLVATSLFVISRQFSGGSGYNRIFFLLIALLFLFPSVIYLLPGADPGSPGTLLAFSYSLENTVAYTLLIVLFWGLTMLSDAGPGSLLLSVALSAVLLWSTWDPKWRPLQSVLRSFCVLFAMMIATFALIRRQKNGIWMVLSLLSLAFALKPQLLAPAIGPFESHNYLKAISVFCVGRAFSAGSAPLFGGKSR